MSSRESFIQIKPVSNATDPSEVSAPETADSEFCQIMAPARFSRLVSPRVLVNLHRLIWHLRNDGPIWTFKRIMQISIRRYRRVARGRTAAPAPLRKAVPPSHDEVLSLQPGEWVCVRSEQEIAETLDENGKNRGLTFLPEMRVFCGGRYRVYKRLERFYLEESQQKRSMKNTVLLSGVICNGGSYRCDRSCLFYWREAWLRRAPTCPDGNGIGPESVERG